MPYIIIEDFKAGLDRRKLPVASPQGSLQTLANAHITRGGEIEKRLEFTPTYSLPEGLTFGLAGADGKLYVFGSVPTPAVPPGVEYQQLVHSGAAVDMTGVVATEFFDGKPWVAAKFADASQQYFYNGVRIADFDVGSGAVAVAGGVVAHMLTHEEKLYCVHSSVLAFSGIEEPQKFQNTGATVGAGFKNMSNQTSGSELLTGLGRYQNNVAVFARRNIQIWFLDPDPLQNVQRQVLSNIGTFAPKSIVPFGEIDVFFLSDSGVRSLRARDASNRAGASDVGTPIDDYLLEYLSTLTETQRARAVGVLEPISGRYILFVGKRAFVFSYFESSRISAWSTYELDFEVTDACVIDGRVWVREGDTLRLLGGADGKTYDSSTVEVDLPYIDGRAIATWKAFTAIDIVCEGQWQVFVNTEPNDPTAESEIAIVGSTTLTQDSIGTIGRSPVVKLRLVNEAPGPARLSKVIIHYNSQEAS